MDAEKLVSELLDYKTRLQANYALTPNERVGRYEELITVIDSSTLRTFIMSSKIALREYADELSTRMKRDITADGLDEILDIIAVFVYEGTVQHGTMLEDSLTNLLLSVFKSDIDKSPKRHFWASYFPARINVLLAQNVAEENKDNMLHQAKKVQASADNVNAKIKENLDTLTSNEKKLKEYTEKAVDLRKKLNFVILNKAFADFINEKSTKASRVLMVLVAMGILLLIIPVGTFVVYQTSKHDEITTVATSNEKVTTANHKDANAVITGQPKSSTEGSGSVKWPDIVSALLHYLPLAVAEIILLFYFRIVLANYNAINAQLLQLKMREAVCQFIEEYINFKKTSEIAELEKFESLIFSNLMPSAEQIPATFEGLEHLGKILGEFKPKKD